MRSPNGNAGSYGSPRDPVVERHPGERGAVKLGCVPRPIYVVGDGHQLPARLCASGHQRLCPAILMAGQQHRGLLWRQARHDRAQWTSKRRTLGCPTPRVVGRTMETAHRCIQVKGRACQQVPAQCRHRRRRNEAAVCFRRPRRVPDRLPPHHATRYRNSCNGGAKAGPHGREVVHSLVEADRMRGARSVGPGGAPRRHPAADVLRIFEQGHLHAHDRQAGDACRAT